MSGAIGHFEVNLDLTFRGQPRPVHFSIQRLQLSTCILNVRPCDKRNRKFWTRLRHSTDPSEVTCKRCLKWLLDETRRILGDDSHRYQKGGDLYGKVLASE